MEYSMTLMYKKVEECPIKILLLYFAQIHHIQIEMIVKRLK